MKVYSSTKRLQLTQFIISGVLHLSLVVVNNSVQQGLSTQCTIRISIQLW
jgi:hypothetical protein